MAKRPGRTHFNKRGSLLDMIFIGIAILVFGVFILLGYKISSAFSDQVTGSDLITDATARNATVTLAGYYPGILDGSLLFLCIGISIAAFCLASLVRVHPIFLPLYFIALIFVILFCGILSNVYQGMAESTALSAEANDLIFTSYILEFLPFIVGILGTILSIVMYKLWQNSQII